MAYMSAPSSVKEVPLLNEDAFLEKLNKEKKIAREYQERKHLDWNDTYELYRNKVKTNRLTQRQAVNIPLMKETIKTILARIDDPPMVNWKEKSGDEIKEIIYQEKWNEQFKTQRYEWKDILDKKNVLLYGLSTKMLNVSDKGPTLDILDVYDVVFDPMMKPLDIESARFIIRQNLFKSLREILADPRYSEEGKNALKMWALTESAMVQSNSNKEEFEKKMKRLQAMGVDSDEFGQFAGGDVIISLTEHYTLDWNIKTKKFERVVCCYAQDTIELLKKPLKELIGIDLWPFVVWSEDPETNDIYCDSVGDIIRVPNKILNVWFSQLVENRTLKNFNMHWFDATKQGFQPQTYEPGPGRMLPAPGNPYETVMPVATTGLDDTMQAIQMVTAIVERATGATAIEKGVGETKRQTLGEIEILVGKAMERATQMVKFYRGSWDELARKWDALNHANNFKKEKLYRTGRSGKVYEKTVYPADWKSDAGYEPVLSSTSEQEQEATKTIQKFMFVQSQSPENGALRKISQKRQLELLDLTPDELKEIQEEEERLQQQREEAAAQAKAMGQENAQQIQEQEMANSLQQNVNQLKSMAV